MSNQNFLLLLTLVWCCGGIVAAGLFEPPKGKLKFAIAFFFLGPIFWLVIACMWAFYGIKKLGNKILKD